MSFELSPNNDNAVMDVIYPRVAQDEAVRAMCDEPLVEILDVQVTTVEGSTTVGAIRVVPAWMD